MSSWKIPDDKVENAKLIFENIKKRRAVRDVKKDPVPDEYIYKVLEAASHAPSPENYEPWRFIIVRDKKKLKIMGEHAIKGCVTMFGTMLPRTEINQRFGYMPPRAVAVSVNLMASGWRMCYIRDAPVQIVVAVDSKRSMAKDISPITVISGAHLNHLPFVCSGLALMNASLMAFALGLGSCVHNFEYQDPTDEREIAEMLNLPQPHWKIAATLSLGIPIRERTLGPPRTPVEKLAFEDEWGKWYQPKNKLDW